MNKIKSTHLIIVQAILFVIFLMVTAWFNRFAADDYYFIGELNGKSFKEIYQQLYFKWHGRWSSNFLLLTFLQLRNLPYFLLFYFLLSYTVLFFAIKGLLQQLKANFSLVAKHLNLYSIIAIGVFFFCTINPNEIWFWYTSSVVYFWSVIAFIFVISASLKAKKNGLDYILFSIAVLYIGGSNEPLTAFLGLFFVYQLFKNKTKANNIIGLILLIIAFYFNYSSSGTLNRDEITPSLGFMDWILYIGFGSIKYLLFTSYKTFIPALFFALPFYGLGKQNKSLKSNFKPIQQFYYSILAIITVVVINQTIVITALGGLSPDRAQISASLFIAFIMIRYLFLLGVAHQEKSFSIQPILILTTIALVVFNVFFFKIHQQFATKYDERINLITTPTTSKIIEVTPLPFSGYIYHPELKNDANYFVNQHTKSGLGIKSELVLKE